MRTMTPQELAETWRADAETLSRHGADSLARICRTHADELDAALRAVADETLDLASAAQESGYSRDRLRHMIAAGELPNAGRKGAPRIRRGDLPMRRGVRASRFDASAAAQRVLGG
jgi:hypothetical protein